MLCGMRGDCGGKEENQGNYSSKVKGDARFHEQLHQKGGPDWQACNKLPAQSRNQYIASKSYCTYNLRAGHSHESGGVEEKKTRPWLGPARACSKIYFAGLWFPGRVCMVPSSPSL